MDIWFILGAGYTGRRLVDRLAREGRDEVIATRRRLEDARALARSYGSVLVRGAECDLARPDTVRVPDGAIVVCLAPPGDDPAGEIRTLAAAAPHSRIVYV